MILVGSNHVEPISRILRQKGYIVQIKYYSTPDNGEESNRIGSYLIQPQYQEVIDNFRFACHSTFNKPHAQKTRGEN